MQPLHARSLSGERVDLGDRSVAWWPCHVGEGTRVGAGVLIGALAHVGRECVLGDGTRVQGGSYLADAIEVGEDAFIGPGATVVNDRHPPARDRRRWRPPVIGARAVLGANSTVVGGVTVGDDAVLAAGAVATEDIPAGEVWAGVPARYLMSRAAYEARRAPPVDP